MHTYKVKYYYHDSKQTVTREHTTDDIFKAIGEQMNADGVNRKIDAQIISQNNTRYYVRWYDALYNRYMPSVFSFGAYEVAMNYATKKAQGRPFRIYAGKRKIYDSTK